LSRVRVCLAAVAVAVAACSGPVSTEGDPAPTPTSGQPRASESAVDDASPVSFPEPFPGEDVNDYTVRCYASFGRIAYNLEKEFPDREFGALAIHVPEPRLTPKEQKNAETCMAIAIEAGILYDNNDPQQVRERYREVLDQVECLKDFGYPTPEPPSEEVFVESKGDFNPYSLMGPYTIRDAGKDCPSDYYGVTDLSDLDMSKLGNSDD
jgi:hypothetical protein